MAPPVYAQDLVPGDIIVFDPMPQQARELDLVMVVGRCDNMPEYPLLIVLFLYNFGQERLHVLDYAINNTVGTSEVWKI